VRELAALRRATLRIAQAHCDMGVEEIRGCLTIREGGTTFVRGSLTNSLHEGSWFLFEEVNLARPGLSSFLNTVIDETAAITIPETDEVVHAHDGFRAFFCLNDCGYAGTRELNPALRDRCVVIYCGYFPPEEELRVLKGHLTDIAEVDARRMIAVANAIREARVAGSTDFDMSMRSLIQWGFDAYRRTASLLDSFTDVILNKVGDPLGAAPQREALLEVARLILEE
jgi:midasin (ATPase involved in ribosome maturation)